jgi:hypothetical protein
MLLGARAANELLLPDTNAERGCATDEQQVRAVADYLKVSAAEFPEWREKQLQRARDIVRIEHVKRTILDVAMDLESALGVGRGLSGKHVRALLLDNKRRLDAARLT